MVRLIILGLQGLEITVKGKSSAIQCENSQLKPNAQEAFS